MFCLKPAVLFLLVAASLWSPSQCQNLDLLTQTLTHSEAYFSAVKEDRTILDQVSEAQDAMDQLWTVHFPEFMKRSTNYHMSPGCVNSTVLMLAHLLHFDNFTGFPEVLTMLDATGKQGAGLLSGNMNLMPAFDECFSRNFTSFCMGPVKLSFLPQFVWNVGMCVPKYCKSSDVTAVMNFTGILDVDENTMKCTDRKRPAYSPGAIIMLVVCALFAVMIILATVLDMILQCITSCAHEMDPMKINDAESKNSTNERTPLVAGTVIVRKRPYHIPMPLQFLMAFSLYKTVPALLATKQAPGIITSLNGLRVISMFWVILGHTYVFIMAGTDNAGTMKNIMARFSFQPVLNGLFSVDSFFFLSGVLVAYLAFRQMKKKGRFPFIHYYVHRYLRLTPTYAFVLFFSWTLINHLAAGPGFSLTSPNPCSKYWWTNLLYINNLYPWKVQDECVGWAWYLANDMQFYIISPLVLVPLYYLFPLGLIISSILLLVGLVITGTLTGIWDFQASQFAPYAYNYTPPPNVTANYMDWIYVKPWARFGPYLIGLLLGYILFKQIKFPYASRITSRLFYSAVWLASGVILILTLYGLYFIWHGHVPSKVENILYILFSRPAWGMGLALLVFACHNGYGWLINTFLSMQIWTPLSRMTFNAYLVHPIVLFVVYGQLQTSVHMTDITMSVYTVAFVVLSYAVAAVVCVCVEFPLGTIEMLLFKLVGLGGRVTQRQGGNEATKEKGEAMMVTKREA